VLSDIPLLYEAKAQRLFDLTVLVLISPEEQIRRLIARNGLTPDEAQKRLQSQMPIGEKIILADIVSTIKRPLKRRNGRLRKSGRSSWHGKPPHVKISEVSVNYSLPNQDHTT